MTAAVGWALAFAAVVVGYLQWGWQGVVLAITVVVFWLLLQFSRALRALRDASGRPLGVIDNAVMLHAKLHPGMRLPQVLKLTRSLGRKRAEAPGGPEAFAWRDGEGSEVQVEFAGGRLVRKTLVRAAAEPAPTRATEAAGDGTRPAAGGPGAGA